MDIVAKRKIPAPAGKQIPVIQAMDSYHTWCGYEVRGTILLHNLIVVKAYRCMLQLIPVTISMH
jgi:hypothetical protein